MMEICASVHRLPHLTKNFSQLMDNTELALWFKTELDRFCVLIGLRKWFIVNTVAMAPPGGYPMMSLYFVIDNRTYLKVDNFLVTLVMTVKRPTA